MFSPEIRILVVDDMMTMRKLVIKALKDLNFKNFAEAGDGAQAWETLSTSKPPFDLVISDLNMPIASGVDLLKKVRGDIRYKRTPFILLTAESEVSVVTTALSEGASGYVVKPFSVVALTVQLERVAAKMQGQKK